MLLDTVEEDEIIGPSVAPTDLLVRLFHQEGPRVFDAQPMRFGCSCSADKVRNTMSIYSQKDIKHMTTDQGVVTADCQFCGAHYELDPRTLGFEGKHDA
jgi:molecular chaperone Hsp33